jgi:hypothetical protein
MMSEADKSTLIREELAKLHSVEERRKNAKSIAKKIGCSEQWVYSEIKKIEAEREAVAKTLFDLFVVRKDTYATQKKDKSYLRIEKPLTIDLARDHLEGKITIGTYNLDKESHVKWLCFDVDVQTAKNAMEIAKKIYGKCVELFPAKSVSLEASRYDDRSYHIWVFFQPEIPAYVAKFLGERVLEKCENPKVELFPKQTKLDKEGFGNLMKIPLGLHQQSEKWSYFLNPQTFEPLRSESLFEIHGCSLPEQDIEEIRRRMEREKPSYWFEQKTEEREAYKGDYPPCVLGILRGVEEGIRNESAIRLACFWLNFCKTTAPTALTSLREWNAKNKPPLEDRELEIVVQSALRGGYNYGCDDPILERFCNQETCLFKEKEPIPIRLIELRAQLADKPVKVKAQVVGESHKMMCCKTVIIECENCGAVEEFDLADPKNYKLLQKRLRFGGDKFKQMLCFFPICSCGKPKRKVNFEGSLDYRVLYCQDLVDPKEKWEAREYKTEDLVLIGEPKEAVLKKIELEGIVTALKRDKITVMVYKVEPLGKPVPSSMEGFDQYFRNNANLLDDLDRTIEPYIQKRPLEKWLVALTLHSPYKLTFEDTPIRGNLMCMLLGETKTGKSDLLEWVEKNIGGEGVRGESARRTGVGYTLDTEKRAIYWGALPRCDKEICMLDGMDKFDVEHDLTQLREAMSSQELRVHMAVYGRALCRTRILASANPKKKSFEGSYKSIAEAIIELFNYDPTLVTRWDIFVPFMAKDVSFEDIAEARTIPPKIPIDVFRNHVFWAWGLEPENVIFSEETMAEIRRLFIELQEYKSESLPLVHAEYKWVLARISASWAVLNHSVNEEGKVVVLKEHVTNSYDLLCKLLEAWELPMYVSTEKGLLEIADTEWADLFGFLTGDTWEIFYSIANAKGTERNVLIQKMETKDVSRATVDRILAGLKERKLIEHAGGRKGGYQLSQRGIKVFREIARRGKEAPKIELPQKDKILSIKALEEPEQGKCAYCGKEAVLYYQVEGFQGEWGLACQDCGSVIEQGFRGAKTET